MPHGAVAWRPDSLSPGSIAREFDIETGAVVRMLKHLEAVQLVVPSSDGGLYTVSRSDESLNPVKSDFVVTLWKPGRSTPESRIGSHFGLLSAVAVSADGRQLFTAAPIEDSHRIWNWSLGKPPADRAQFVRDNAKRCLSIARRLQLTLGPRPPSCCVGKEPFKDGSLTNHASALRHYSDGALYNGDFESAILAADLALEIDPGTSWVNINKAHALLHLNRTGQAKALYLSGKGSTFDIGSKTYDWNDTVLSEPRLLSLKRLDHPAMDEIRALLREPGPPKP